MEEHVTKLTEILYVNSRLRMDFFMPVPDGIYTNKDRDGVQVNQYPFISIRCLKNKDNEEIYDFSKASFRVTVHNHFQVNKFFNTIMKWLFTDEFNDLFVMGPTNKLMFNSDYKSLRATVPFYGKSGTQVLSAIPSVVKFDDVLMEGVHLFINTTDYVMPLSHREIETMFSILTTFNFSAEVTKLITMLGYLVSHNAIRPSINETKTPFG